MLTVTCECFSSIHISPFAFAFQVTLAEEVAPETRQFGIFTEYSDVFSFGVLLAFLFNLSLLSYSEVIEVINTDSAKLRKPAYADYHV